MSPEMQSDLKQTGNMSEKELKSAIQQSLLKFSDGKLAENTLDLFQTLSYNIERQAPLANRTYNDTRTRI